MIDPHAILSLTDEQAIRACVYFFDHTPDEYWPDGQRPSHAELSFLTEEAAQQAQGTEKLLIEKLREQNLTLGGAIARKLLERFAQDPQNDDLLAASIEDARQPKMSAIVITSGAVILALGYILLGGETTEETRPDGTVIKSRKRDNLSDVLKSMEGPAKLITAVTDLIKEIKPTGILNKL